MMGIKDKVVNIFSSEARKKKIAEETRLIQQKTFAMEQQLEMSKKALEAIGNISMTTQTLNNELYGSGKQPYASKIWESSASQARRLSRIAYWESTPAQAMIGRFVDLVHGPKLELQASPVWDIITGGPKTPIDRQKFIKNIETRWRLWAKSKSSDYIGDKNHHQRSRQLFENLLLEGEYFVILRYPATRNRNPLTVQIVSPDNVMRVDSKVNNGNTEADGIEYNSKGQAVAYHFKTADGKSKRVPKFGPRSGRQFVIHNKLGNARRGVGILAGIISELTKLADFQALEIQAAVINAIFAMVVETQVGGNTKPFTKKEGIGANVDQKTGLRTNVSDFQSQIDTVQKNYGGVVVDQLGEGQTLKSVDTKRPTANFEQFFKATLRNIYSSKGMAYDVVMYDPDASYSAIRSNLLLLWNRIMTLRFDHICDFEQIIYKMWLLGEIEKNNIQMPGFETNETIQDAWSAATFTGPSRPDIDPEKSMNAHKMEIEEGVKTRQMVTAERGGGDYDENIIRLAAENQQKATASEPVIKQEKTSYSFSENKTESKSESTTIDQSGGDE
jgi:lambda family phage portal protein